MMRTLANSAAFWVVLILVLCVLYLLPTIIGTARRVDRLALVFLVNLIGGTTGVGWLAALILAFGPRRLLPAQPVSWSPPDGLPVPRPPRVLAQDHGLIAMHADAGEPDHFGRGGASSDSRQGRHGW
jgi:hypothetical protein